MRPGDAVLWYGRAPLAGEVERLELRGATVLHIKDSRVFHDIELSKSAFAVLAILDGDTQERLPDAKLMRRFIDHGLAIVVIGPSAKELIITNYFEDIDPNFSWETAVRFVPDLFGISFDFFVETKRTSPWREVAISGEHDEITEIDRLLIQRAFQQASEIWLSDIRRGFSGSRVFMALEKRQRSSIAHWAQPKLVKIGSRSEILREVLAMQEVSHFVPFDLRPNWETSVAGFSKALYVADFVDRSVSLLRAAREGRAEAAISNFFNRTLAVWRQCALERDELSTESLALAAERLEMFTIENVKLEYRESATFTSLNVDLDELWRQLKEVSTKHRVATIHGDLHGDNVRVRGDDAILIDLGSVRGDDTLHGGAPVCFDVAMLEVALAFQCLDQTECDLSFYSQDRWVDEVSQYYAFDHLLSALRVAPDLRRSWLHGCIQRIRAFGVYEQRDPLEYPIALAIAMLRWCKFPSMGSNDRGRRVIALKLAVMIVQEVLNRQEQRRA